MAYLGGCKGLKSDKRYHSGKRCKNKNLFTWDVHMLSPWRIRFPLLCKIDCLRRTLKKGLNVLLRPVAWIKQELSSATIALCVYMRIFVLQLHLLKVQIFLYGLNLSGQCENRTACIRSCLYVRSRLFVNLVAVVHFERAILLLLVCDTKVSR